jgi:hypothetical protein
MTESEIPPRPLLCLMHGRVELVPGRDAVARGENEAVTTPLRSTLDCLWQQS